MQLGKNKCDGTGSGLTLSGVATAPITSAREGRRTGRLVDDGVEV